MSKTKPVKAADPNAAALAAGLAFVMNVRQRVGRLWDDVSEFRELCKDPGNPLFGVFAADALAALSGALESADQEATGMMPAARVEPPDLTPVALRAFGG